MSTIRQVDLKFAVVRVSTAEGTVADRFSLSWNSGLGTAWRLCRTATGWAAKTRPPAACSGLTRSPPQSRRPSVAPPAVTHVGG